MEPITIIEYEKVENINRPLQIGEKYLVTCLVKRDNHENIIAFTPVIDVPHSDKENDQAEVHYHADYRFIRLAPTNEYIVLDDRPGFKNSRPRVHKGIDGEIEHHVLEVVSEKHVGTAQLLFIRNSKFKHKCIHKGKCPHRGYDLSQIKPINGIITCPLHGLEFHADSGKITENTLENLALTRKFDEDRKTAGFELAAKLSEVKDGDTISLKKFYEIKCQQNEGYQITECPRNGFIHVTYKRQYSAGLMPKPLVNQPVLKFRVKL